MIWVYCLLWLLLQRGLSALPTADNSTNETSEAPDVFPYEPTASGSEIDETPSRRLENKQNESDPSKRDKCVFNCLDMTPPAETPSSYLQQQYNVPIVQRLVLYVYSVPSETNPLFFVHIPGRTKQSILPDMPLHEGDLFNMVTIPIDLPSLFKNKAKDVILTGRFQGSPKIPPGLEDLVPMEVRKIIPQNLQEHEPSPSIPVIGSPQSTDHNKPNNFYPQQEILSSNNPITQGILPYGNVNVQPTISTSSEPLNSVQTSQLQPVPPSTFPFANNPNGVFPNTYGMTTAAYGTSQSVTGLPIVSSPSYQNGQNSNPNQFQYSPINPTSNLMQNIQPIGSYPNNYPKGQETNPIQINQEGNINPTNQYSPEFEITTQGYGNVQEPVYHAPSMSAVLPVDNQPVGSHLPLSNPQNHQLQVYPTDPKMNSNQPLNYPNTENKNPVRLPIGNNYPHYQSDSPLINPSKTMPQGIMYPQQANQPIFSSPNNYPNTIGFSPNTIDSKAPFQTSMIPQNQGMSTPPYSQQLPEGLIPTSPMYQYPMNLEMTTIKYEVHSNERLLPDATSNTNHNPINPAISPFISRPLNSYEPSSPFSGHNNPIYTMNTPTYSAPEQYNPGQSQDKYYGPVQFTPGQNGPASNPQQIVPGQSTPLQPSQNQPATTIPKQIGPDQYTQNGPVQYSPEEHQPTQYASTPNSPSSNTPEQYAPGVNSPEQNTPGHNSPGLYYPGQYGPAQTVPAQYAPNSPMQFNPGQNHPSELSTGQISPDPKMPQEYGVIENAPQQYGPGIYSPEQITPAQYTPEQYGTPNAVPVQYPSNAPNRFPSVQNQPLEYAVGQIRPEPKLPLQHDVQENVPKQFSPGTYNPAGFLPVQHTSGQYGPDQYRPSETFPAQYIPNDPIQFPSGQTPHSQYIFGQLSPQAQMPGKNNEWAPNQYEPGQYTPTQNEPVQHTPGQYSPLQPEQNMPLQTTPNQYTANGPSQYIPGEKNEPTEMRSSPASTGPNPLQQYDNGVNTPVKYRPGQYSPEQNMPGQNTPGFNGPTTVYPGQYNTAQYRPTQTGSAQTSQYVPFLNPSEQTQPTQTGSIENKPAQYQPGQYGPGYYSPQLNNPVQYAPGENVPTQYNPYLYAPVKSAVGQYSPGSNQPTQPDIYPGRTGLNPYTSENNRPKNNIDDQYGPVQYSPIKKDPYGTYIPSQHISGDYLQPGSGKNSPQQNLPLPNIGQNMPGYAPYPLNQPILENQQPSAQPTPSSQLPQYMNQPIPYPQQQPNAYQPVSESYPNGLQPNPQFNPSAPNQPNQNVGTGPEKDVKSWLVDYIKKPNFGASPMDENLIKALFPGMSIPLNVQSVMSALQTLPLDTSNIKLLPIMIGTTSITEQFLPALEKDISLFRNMPYIEAIAVTTLNPPSIVGILPFGLSGISNIISGNGGPKMQMEISTLSSPIMPNFQTTSSPSSIEHLGQPQTDNQGFLQSNGNVANTVNSNLGSSGIPNQQSMYGTQYNQPMGNPQSNQNPANQLVYGGSNQFGQQNTLYPQNGGIIQDGRTSPSPVVNIGQPQLDSQRFSHSNVNIANTVNSGMPNGYANLVAFGFPNQQSMYGTQYNQPTGNQNAAQLFYGSSNQFGQGYTSYPQNGGIVQGASVSYIPQQQWNGQVNNQQQSYQPNGYGQSYNYNPLLQSGATQANPGMSFIPGYRILGGSAAVGSGAPISSKGR